MNISFKKTSQKIFNQITKNYSRLESAIEHKFEDDFCNVLREALEKTDFDLIGNEEESFMFNVGCIWSGNYKKLDREEICYAFQEASLHYNYNWRLISKSKLIKILDKILDENEKKEDLNYFWEKINKELTENCIQIERVESYDELLPSILKSNHPDAIR